MTEDLSQVTREILKRIGGKFRVHLDGRERMRYFLSEGTGMELWWLLKSKDFTPEELETCKNELCEKDLIEIIEREELPPYYVRFQGRLARMTRPVDRDKYSRGQVRMKKEEERTRIKFREKMIDRYRNGNLDEDVEKVVESGLEFYSSEEDSREESITYLKDKGLDRDHLTLEMNEEEKDEVVHKLEAEGLAEVDKKVNERKVCHFFVSEWVQREDKRTRFLFSPEIFEKYLE